MEIKLKSSESETKGINIAVIFFSGLVHFSFGAVFTATIENVMKFDTHSQCWLIEEYTNTKFPIDMEKIFYGTSRRLNGSI